MLLLACFLPAQPSIIKSNGTGTTRALRDPGHHPRQPLRSLPRCSGKEESSGVQEGAVPCHLALGMYNSHWPILFNHRVTELTVKAWSLVPLRRCWHNTSRIVQHPLIKHPIAQPCIAIKTLAARSHCSAQCTFPHTLQQTPTHNKNKCSRVNAGALLSRASCHQKDTTA